MVPFISSSPAPYNIVVDQPPLQPDDSVPIPPRYWWLKRICLATGIFFILLLALRLWWGYEAHRRLQAEIDRIIAAGEPIYPEDFDPKEEIPDDQNAAKLLEAAATALSFIDDDQNMVQGIRSGPQALAESLDKLANLYNNNLAALSLVKRARSAPQADWQVRVRTPVVSMLSVQRKVAIQTRADSMEVDAAS